MTWHLTPHVDEFRRAAAAYLEADPAGCTTLLTVTETVRRHGLRPDGDDDDDALFGWWRRSPGGPVEAAFLHTPPAYPMLGPMPEEAAHELARTLRRRPRVHGVRGGDGAARAFADAWTAAGEAPGAWTVARRTRLFRLGTLTPPHPAAPGRARRATPDDVPFAAAWMQRFAADIGEDAAADYTRNVTRRVAHGGLYVWESGDRPVSMAAHSPLVAGQSRVSPVYTPPEQRGRGYAGAVTTAVARAAQAAGARHVLLFADLANPTSNALYQRLGFRPLADHLDITFNQLSR
ncbi:GNAT family N-acetyltransferase [Streptomyces ficellus]|uniref:GNAT family N-acetyltransferase n=1 Tax=Streptomyces ficellus TaxID=1977088 RepID=A0ABT7ZA07_9ACTN|nr:GNAT family N-acetyltransferase [Streptomyces ficellus]MDN3296342.1 GNAT family N-acetyltransferase [Streptomyces ficellus]